MTDQEGFWLIAIIVGLGAIVLVAIASFIFRGGKPSAEESPLMICPNCGSFGRANISTPGSAAVELLLYLFFLVPGIFYGMWRRTARKALCPSCGAAGLVPHNSPRGRQLEAQYHAPAD